MLLTGEQLEKLVAFLRHRLIDTTPQNITTDPVAIARDRGYREGWNDSLLAVVREVGAL